MHVGNYYFPTCVMWNEYYIDPRAILLYVVIFCNMLLQMIHFIIIIFHVCHCVSSRVAGSSDMQFLYNVCALHFAPAIYAEGPRLRHEEAGEYAVQSVRHEAVCACEMYACCMRKKQQHKTWDTLQKYTR